VILFVVFFFTKPQRSLFSVESVTFLEIGTKSIE